jgi:hypothetical protein
MLAGRLGAARITLVVIAAVVFMDMEIMPGDACTAHPDRDAARERRCLPPAATAPA